MIGMEYHDNKRTRGKHTPHRGYYELNGKKTYVGYFEYESEAWRAAAKALKAQTRTLDEADYVQALTGAGSIR